MGNYYPHDIISLRGYKIGKKSQLACFCSKKFTCNRCVLSTVIIFTKNNIPLELLLLSKLCNCYILSETTFQVFYNQYVCIGCLFGYYRDPEYCSQNILKEMCTKNEIHNSMF